MVKSKMVKPWYLSNWHSKAYGLVVDPWSAGESVPYLCAVSLHSSCEDFSEPKRMSRGTNTKTTQSGSPRNFAHVNKFSILASGDDESPSECRTTKQTSRIQCQSRRCGDERSDECRRGRRPGTLKVNADQVSYFAASGGDSKGVHHVSGSGWRRLSAIVDSGSAECVTPESIAKNIPVG